MLNFYLIKTRNKNQKKKKKKIKERIVDVTSHTMLLLLFFHKTHATPPENMNGRMSYKRKKKMNDIQNNEYVRCKSLKLS